MTHMMFAKSNMTPEESANFYSHNIGVVDDCYRCVYCEIGVWNAHKAFCR